MIIVVEDRKQLAAAGDYAAEDVLSESVSVGTPWKFERVGPSGFIYKAQVLCSTTGLTPRLTLYLFNDIPTCALIDNAANTAPLHADLSKYIGKIDFPAMEDLGGDSEVIAVPSTYGNIPLAYRANMLRQNLYGILVTRDAITGEAAAMEVVIKLAVRQEG